MDVSIIIINYNTLKLTQECIQSIKKTTFDLKYEIIVVDNNSKDDVFSLIKLFEDIIIIKNEKNVGFAAGNNVGIGSAKGKCILLLNSDTLILNNAIKIGYERLLQDKCIGALTVKTWFPNKVPQVVVQKFPSISNNLIVLFRIDKLLSKKWKEDLFLDVYFDHKQEKLVDWIFGSFFMFRKEIVINEFPESKLQERFFMYAEDLQWCYYFKKLGYKILFNPEGEILHYGGASDQTRKNNSQKYFDIMLPNEFSLVKENKGKLWAFVYYFSKGLIHFSAMKRIEFQIGINYLKYALKAL